MNTDNEQISNSSQKEYCLEVKITRDSKTGEISVFAKSPKNWSSLYDKEGKGNIVRWAGVECYLPQVSQLHGVRASFCPESQDMWYSDLPNLMLLTAKNLGEGVTFKFGAFPVSQERIEEWAQKLKEEAKTIFLSYIKPFGIKMTITCETVESEIHY